MTGTENSGFRGGISWKAKAVLLVTGLFLGVLLAEMAMRVQEPFLHIMRDGIDAQLGNLVLSVQHPLWHHAPRPNARVVFGTRDIRRFPRPIEIVTNSWGCRYPRDPQIPKPRDVRRIVVLGDSFAFGYYYEDTVAARLETALNQGGTKYRYEVINCAFSSYSPMVYYVQLTSQIMRMEPDEVLIALDLTDVYDDYWSYRPFAEFTPEGAPIRIGRPNQARRQLKEVFFQRLDLFRAFVMHGSPTSAATPPTTPAAAPTTAPAKATKRETFDYYDGRVPVESPEWKKEVGFFVDNVARIGSYCQSKKLPLTVAMHPHRPQIQANPGEELWNRKVEMLVGERCAQMGIPFYSAFDGLAEAFRRDPTIYWTNDMHFTPTGQRVWADLIVRYWMQRQPASLQQTVTY